MKNVKTTAIWLAVAALLVLTPNAFAKEPKGVHTKHAAIETGVPGGVFVETFTTTSKIEAIDAPSRNITLVNSDGTKTSFKAGPEVKNFDQLKVGDQVKATVVQELVVSMQKSGTPAQTGRAAGMETAPKGQKPGAVMVETVQITAKVEALDLKKRNATLRFADGKSKTFPVRPDVDLTTVKIGDEVVMRKTQALALVVEKP